MSENFSCMAFAIPSFRLRRIRHRQFVFLHIIEAVRSRHRAASDHSGSRYRHTFSHSDLLRISVYAVDGLCEEKASLIRSHQSDRVTVEKYRVRFHGKNTTIRAKNTCCAVLENSFVIFRTKRGRIVCHPRSAEDLDKHKYSS